jgi:hypothetical protein
MFEGAGDRARAVLSVMTSSMMSGAKPLRWRREPGPSNCGRAGRSDFLLSSLSTRRLHLPSPPHPTHPLYHFLPSLAHPSSPKLPAASGRADSRLSAWK